MQITYLSALSFNKNHPMIFVLVGIVIAFVMAQSVFFLVKGLKRAKAIGMDTKKINGAIKSSAIFTIAPAVAILIGVISLSKKLGVALPWLRLSIIGALTYELTAAEAAAAAVGASFNDATALTGNQYITIVVVMTLGIIVSMILCPVLCRKINNGVSTMQKKNSVWTDILLSSLFMGMISAFLGLIFGDVMTGLKGWIPVFVMLVSAVVMMICGLLLKKLHWQWLQDYALPISMLAGMIMAIPITNWII